MKHYTRRMRQLLALLLRRFPRSLSLPEYFLRRTRPRYAIGVVGVVMNDNREVLLVEHLFHPRTPWGLPGGWSNHRETPTESLCRELNEELGLSVEIDSLLLLERGVGNHLDFAYLCRTCSNITHLNGELLRWRWVAEAELSNYAPLQKFHRHALTVAFSHSKSAAP